MSATVTLMLDQPGRAPGHFTEVPPPSPMQTPPQVRRPPVTRLARGVTPYLYLVPALAGVVIWVYSPLVQTLRLSFYNWNLSPASPALPAGTSNYRKALDLPELGTAALNTVWYLLALLPFTVVIPVIVVLATRRVRGRASTVYRAAIFMPYLVAPVVAAIVWRWLLDPHGGLVNQVLGVLGIGPVAFLRDPDWAMWSIVVIVGWQLLGFAVLVVSSGLSAISDDYTDAARIDGASEGRITLRITLPLLSPTLLFMATLTILAAAQLVFPMIQTLTQGGPGDATTNLYYLLYDTAFGSFDVGLASAAGVLFFLGFSVIAWGLVRLMDKWSFHDD